MQEKQLVLNIMNEVDAIDIEILIKRICSQANAENIRITQHAQEEMVDENISLDETLEAIATGQILENYSKHRRGACCLLYGITMNNRPLHIVCTTAQPILIIITVMNQCYQSG